MNVMPSSAVGLAGIAVADRNRHARSHPAGKWSWDSGPFKLSGGKVDRKHLGVFPKAESGERGEGSAGLRAGYNGG
jgi:hypothetical protein